MRRLPTTGATFLDTFTDSLRTAWALIAGADASLAQVVVLSLQVSGAASLIGAALGLAAGAWLAVARFPGRRALVLALNTLLALPPVVVGLTVYLLLSRAGPLGEFGLLFTPTAMVIAQTVLVLPLVAALARQLVVDAMREGGEPLRSMGAGPLTSAALLLVHERAALLTIGLTAFGRAISEVGAVMIVGGNIAGVTRVMTTTIALETSKGELALAQAVVYLAVAPKSNAVYRAWNEVRAFVQRDGTRPVPLRLRNAPTALMKSLDHGRGYRYAHDEEGGFAAGERYLPDDLPDLRFYEPVPRGLELRIGERLAELRAANARAAAGEAAAGSRG